MDEEEVLDVLKGILPDSVDDDTLEYMSGMLAAEPVNSAQDFWELVGDFLEEVEACSGEAEGLKIGQKYCAAIGVDASNDKENDDTIVMLSSDQLEQLKESKEAHAEQEQKGFGDVFGGIGMSAAQLAAEEELDELPQQTLAAVEVAARLKREKLARRDARRRWKAQEMTDDGCVWVDMPVGTSIVGSGLAQDLHLDNFSLPNKSGTGDLLTDTDAVFAIGRRYGIIGKNGCGKSTFMDAMARRELKGMENCGTMFYVRQEVSGDDRTSLEWVLQADTELQQHRAEVSKIEALGEKASAEETSRLAELYGILANHEEDEGKESEKRAREVLRGLGFSDEQVGTKTDNLSGGWRMRVALACALFVRPVLLLLDEPTNHLDLETVIWLERYLKTEIDGSTLILVSHDRQFLNDVVTDIVLFENNKLQTFRGDYYSFEKTVEEQRIKQERQREAQEAKREHLQKFITEHGQAGHNGVKDAKQRKARMKKLDRLGYEAAAQNTGRKVKVSYEGAQEEVQELESKKQVVLRFPDPGLCNREEALVRCTDVSFGYDKNKPLFNKSSFSVTQKSRLAVLGKNGCGKSTLIKLIMGELAPTAGIAWKDPGARVEYVAQHHLDHLDANMCPLDFFMELYPGDASYGHEESCRRHLALFGIAGETLPFQLIKTLSGGQKCRLSLAIIMYRKPHICILDEPTNHLDMETIDALIKACETYEAGLLVVSHDQHMIKNVCDEILVIDGKKIKQFDGGIDDYKKRIIREIKN